MFRALTFTLALAASAVAQSPPNFTVNFQGAPVSVAVVNGRPVLIVVSATGLRVQCDKPKPGHQNVGVNVVGWGAWDPRECSRGGGLALRWDWFRTVELPLNMLPGVLAFAMPSQPSIPLRCQAQLDDPDPPYVIYGAEWYRGCYSHAWGPGPYVSFLLLEPVLL